MKRLAVILRDLRDVFVSLKLTVALLLFSIILVLVATLDQVNLGIWVVQAKYFNTFIVYWPVGNRSVPVFPGGYTLGGLLLLNLIAAHTYRFTFSWRKVGIWLAHAGLVLLLIGQLLTGLLQDEYQMRIDEGGTKNYSESYRNVELAITDTSDPQFDEVVAIPEGPLARRTSVQHPRLPFRVAVQSYLPNSTLQEMAGPTGGANPATKGIGPRIVATLRPPTFKHDERNLPAAYVEFAGPDGAIGTWLVSPQLEPQRFDFGGRTWEIALRFARHYKPYTLTLLEFTHDRYPGTEIPRNFSSRLRLTTPDGRDDREVLIYMNNPLRYGGLTFYQAGFENNDRTTVLQVVRNPELAAALHRVRRDDAGVVVAVRHPPRGVCRPPPPPGERRDRAAPVRRSSRAAPALDSRADLRPGGARTRLGGDRGLAASRREPAARTTWPALAACRRWSTAVPSRSIRSHARHSSCCRDASASSRRTGERLRPIEWLLDMLYRPAEADAYPVFEVVHPEVLTLLNLKTADGVRRQALLLSPAVRARLPEIDRQARLADADRDPAAHAFSARRPPAAQRRAALSKPPGFNHCPGGAGLPRPAREIR